MAQLHSYQWMWFADMALALGAALVKPADPRGGAGRHSISDASIVSTFPDPASNTMWNSASGFLNVMRPCEFTVPT